MDTTFISTYPHREQLIKRLDNARIRKKRLSCRGEDTTQISDEILIIKRELRRGGQLYPGDQLGDRYLLLNQIGRGGYATVWRGYDNQQNCNVAIKALNTSEAANNTSVERFFRGARIMSEFANIDGIVTVLNPKCDDDGYLYFVMELISGGNLHEAVLEKRKSSSDAIPIMQRVLEILENTHNHPSRCVHRVIKPTNIMLTPDDRIKLTDFDLVTSNNTTGGTRTGMLGTFVFAAPEQMHRPQEADHRADIFGVAMTGIFVIHGNDLPPSAWRRPEDFIIGLDTTTGVKDALVQATEEDPNDRFATASEFLDALQNAERSGRKTVHGRSSYYKSLRKRKILGNSTPLKQKKRYPIPKLSHRKVEEAFEIFDHEHRRSNRWRSFENNKNHRYAIEYRGKRYPVKMILSLATGLPINNFSGGIATNKRIKDLGFNIIRLFIGEQNSDMNTKLG